jgi:hypothetical protein
MARGPGRPSRGAQAQILKRDEPAIISALSDQPLRGPVDPEFSSYYMRVLNGDLGALLDYCDDFQGFFSEQYSFYELLGRLVVLQHIDAAKHVVAEIGRRGKFLNAPPFEVFYQSCYKKLKLACEIARQFIRSEHDDTEMIENLWNTYFEKCYVSWRVDNGSVPWSQELRRLKLRIQAVDSKGQKTSLNEQLELLSMHFVVPMRVFVDLATRSRGFYSLMCRDKRRQCWKYRWTPSFIARKYACKVFGISPSTISHKNRRK